ncbi:hypothetical protein F4781DRAFT_353324 [Annulohypoxylon bovei var. microspora]|nr:hypothetical protein F4781DRAFT_353324 [Annulohypoxylon bovei var. microspora]
MLMTTCGKHDRHASLYDIFHKACRDCICRYVERFMCSMVTAILSLMWCRFDASRLRIREDALERLYTDAEHFDVSGDNVMVNVMSLITGDDIHELQRQVGMLGGTHRILGLSSGRYTIGYTSILHNDCYDDQGRFITLWSGQPSVNGAMRSIIIEKHDYIDPFPQRNERTQHFISSVASGSFLEPHYCPSDTHICMIVSLNEDSILL